MSIITVNFNQAQVTLELLASLQHITYPSVEIWVVDNGSLTNPAEEIKKQFPQVKVIRSVQNLGFAGGNNLAVTQARGKYLMFLNNDTEVEPGFLEPLVAHMEQNPRTGICAAKLRFFHGDQRIQFAGSTPLHPIKIQSFALGYGQKFDDYPDALEKETALAHGAAMMVRSSVIPTVGLMPEEYFLYYEEVDWCEKIKAAGFQIWYIPTSVVLHKESISVGKKSKLQVYYKTRNRIWLAKKWRTGWSLKKSMGYLALVGLRDFIQYTLSAQWALAKAVYQAWIWHLRPTR